MVEGSEKVSRSSLRFDQVCSSARFQCSTSCDRDISQSNIRRNLIFALRKLSQIAHSALRRTHTESEFAFASVCTKDKVKRPSDTFRVSP